MNIIYYLTRRTIQKQDTNHIKGLLQRQIEKGMFSYFHSNVSGDGVLKKETKKTKFLCLVEVDKNLREKITLTILIT